MSVGSGVFRGMQASRSCRGESVRDASIGEDLMIAKRAIGACRVSSCCVG